MSWSGNTLNSVFMGAIGFCGAFTLGIGINVYNITSNDCTNDIYQSSLRVILIIGAVILTMAIAYFSCHAVCGSSIFAVDEGDDGGDNDSGLFRMNESKQGRVFFVFLILLTFILGVLLLVYSYKMTGVADAKCVNAKVTNNLNYLKLMGFIMVGLSGPYMLYKGYALFAKKTAKRRERQKSRKQKREEQAKERMAEKHEKETAEIKKRAEKTRAERKKHEDILTRQKARQEAHDEETRQEHQLHLTKKELARASKPRKRSQKEIELQKMKNKQKVEGQSKRRYIELQKMRNKQKVEGHSKRRKRVPSGIDFSAGKKLNPDAFR